MLFFLLIVIPAFKNLNIYSCQMEIRENLGRGFFPYQGKIFRHSLSYGDKF